VALADQEKRSSRERKDVKRRARTTTRSSIACLTAKAVEALAEGLREIAALPDPG
jgi:hypothetical protein